MQVRCAIQFSATRSSDTVVRCLAAALDAGFIDASGLPGKVWADEDEEETE